MFTLSAPSKSGYKGEFETLAEVRAKAADLLSDGDAVTTPATMVEIEAGTCTSDAMTYCYASQEDADADLDGAYAVKYWQEEEKATTSLEVVFDDGGSVTIQCDGYAHIYDDAAQAADDARQILAGADPSGWDGNEPDARIAWTDEDVRNGGYRVYDAEGLRNPKPDEDWQNVSDFFQAFRNA